MVFSTLKRYFSLLVFLAGIHQTVHAETKYYDVEVIIYEDARASYLSAEQWEEHISPLEDQTTSQTGSANEITDDIPLDSRVAEIEPLILKEEAKRVRVSSNYNLLWYSAWRQPGLDKENAFEIDIDTLENHAIRKSKNTINGHLKVVLARYLHFYAELDYQREAMVPIQKLQPETVAGEINQNLLEGELAPEITPDTDEPEELVPAIQHFRIISHRRMRSKELHYLDHPLIGILVQINPSSVPDEPVVEDKTNPTPVNKAVQ